MGQLGTTEEKVRPKLLQEMVKMVIESVRRSEEREGRQRDMWLEAEKKAESEAKTKKLMLECEERRKKDEDLVKKSRDEWLKN